MKFKQLGLKTNKQFWYDNEVVFLLRGDGSDYVHSVSACNYLGGQCDCCQIICADEMIVVGAYMVRDGKLVEIEIDDLIKLGGEND